MEINTEKGEKNKRGGKKWKNFKTFVQMVFCLTCIFPKKSKTRRRGEDPAECQVLIKGGVGKNITEELLNTSSKDAYIDDKKADVIIESVEKAPPGPVTRVLQTGGDFLLELEAQNLVQTALYLAKKDFMLTVDEKDILLQEKAKVIVDEAIQAAMNYVVANPVGKESDTDKDK
uniref:uncharacterized protein LOC120345033 n=1 Tax=Styela clava TaxID=7725 RepID=UPI0019394862|nr:uncharacterized protein LOC120345033 [Styela clava]